MSMTELLGESWFRWYHVLLFVGLIGLVVFYVKYRRNQM